MPRKKIILLFSDGKSNEDTLSQYFSDKSVYWIYLGPNYINFKRIDSYLRDHFRCIEISEKIDHIANSIRDQYLQYVDNLNNANKDSFEWWFTPISSRNPSMSGVFQNICFLELIKEVLSDASITSETQRIVIIAENYSIGHAIESNADVLNVEIITIGKNKKSIHDRLISGVWWIGKCLFKAGLNHISAKVSALRLTASKKPRRRYYNISGKVALIYVFVYEENFAIGGEFADRYFPGLEQFLLKNNYNVIYFPIFAGTNLNKYSIFCKARENDRIFLIEQDFLFIRDYFMAIRSAIRSINISLDEIHAPLFDGFKVGQIDEGDFKWDCFENIFKAYLQYHAFINMSQTLGYKIERIIAWHENFLQDKAMCKAVHDKFKGCTIVGSHAYIHYLNELNLYPLHYESVWGYSPDTLLSSGPIATRDLERYAINIPVIASIPFRYTYLYSKSSQHPNQLKLMRNRDILVMLPYSRVQSVELLSRVLRSVKNSIDAIYVRCHPDFDESEILNLLNEKTHHANLKFVNKEKLSDLFSRGYVVISVASGVIIEAIAYGNPTIIVSSNNAVSTSPIDMNDTYKNDYIVICYDDKSLYDAINKLMVLPVCNINQLDESLVKKFLYPDTEEYLLPYLL